MKSKIIVSMLMLPIVLAMSAWAVDQDCVNDMMDVFGTLPPGMTIDWELFCPDQGTDCSTFCETECEVVGEGTCYESCFQECSVDGSYSHAESNVTVVVTGGCCGDDCTDVPEFSTVTLVAAVAIAGLGLTFLRKK